MTNSSKRRRIIQKYYVFFVSCFWSLLGLVFFLLGKYYFPFPHREFNEKIVTAESFPEEIKVEKKLFFLAMSSHFWASFLSEIFFFILNFGKEDRDYQKLRRQRWWVNKLLVVFGSIIWSLSKGKFFLLPTLTLVIVNCCLFEILTQLMNQYGVCSSFRLLFFAENILDKPINLFENPKFAFLLFIITVPFIWITNLKWEVPIETNTLYNPNNKLTSNFFSHLGFKVNLSLMPLLYLSWLISPVLNWIMATIGANNWSFWKCLANHDSNQNNKQIFGWEYWKREKKLPPNIITFFFLIFLRFLVSWLQTYHFQWKPDEISKDLQKRGIYLDGVPSGRSTRQLLKIVINKIVAFWFFIIIIFSLIFDNLNSFFGCESPLDLSSISWFTSASVGADLIRQIRTKYEYIQVK
jgi:preprotein translocase subunit SecY